MALSGDAGMITADDTGTPQPRHEAKYIVFVLHCAATVAIRNKKVKIYMLWL